MKKKIIISPEGGDFSMDLLFAGLVDVFGPANVFDYPIRKKHRQGNPELLGDDEKDYGSERRSLCYTQHYEKIENKARNEIISLLNNNEVDFIFLNETEESYKLYLQLLNKTVKVVVVAGHDSYRGTIENTKKMYGNKLSCIFVDDWQKEYEKYKNIYLINLSENFNHLWNQKKSYEKKYDLCFIGYNSHPLRAKYIDYVMYTWSHLNNFIVFEKTPNRFCNFIRHQQMFDAMKESKICINLPGASKSGRALRFYEIPFVGSFMLSHAFPASQLYPFKNNVHCSYFNNIETFDEKIYFFLRNENVREKIALNGKEHLNKNHTHVQRISYMYEILK